MRLAAFAAVALVIATPVVALAHGGGLDGLGCHHNRELGGYHCHRGPLAGQDFASKSEALQALPGAQPQPTPKAAPPARPTPTPAPSSATITGRASVIDGDTLEIHGQRIRLYGIDAPESGQTCRADGKDYRCGQEAALALSDKIGQRPVSCDARDTDRYGRIVAVCWLGSEDLNAWLILEGWALAYRRYSLDYVWAEDAAKVANRGMWRGEFQAPWDWRRGQRLEAAASEPGECRIKGNISSKGEHIYHVPGGRYYDRTRIDPSKGERWFCSKAEAQAAGWRRSKQ